MSEILYHDNKSTKLFEESFKFQFVKSSVAITQVSLSDHVSVRLNVIVPADTQEVFFVNHEIVKSTSLNHNKSSENITSTLSAL